MIVAIILNVCLKFLFWSDYEFPGFLGTVCGVVCVGSIAGSKQKKKRRRENPPNNRENKFQSGKEKTFRRLQSQRMLVLVTQQQLQITLSQSIDMFGIALANFISGLSLAIAEPQIHGEVISM